TSDNLVLGASCKVQIRRRKCCKICSLDNRGLASMELSAAIGEGVLSIIIYQLMYDT
ncbi:MAG: hypothetical protein ACI84B_001125, partial [Oceanospirillaceae bacterium]